VSAAFMLGLGAFGLALAALGVYGVIAFSVAQRTPEFAVRMALGASTRNILPLVLRRSATIVGIGLLLGAGAAVALNRLLAAFLTEVGPVDVPILAGAMTALVISAGAACLVPALAAAKLDPVRALRAE
jgi:putative ABC transport system permease protein